MNVIAKIKENQKIIILLLFVITILGFTFIKPEVTGYSILEASTPETFNLGNYSGTFYNSSGFVQLSPGQIAGTYTSKVFDAGASTTWVNLSWIRELVNQTGVSTDSAWLVLHMDETISVPGGTLFDSSGYGGHASAILTGSGVCNIASGKRNSGCFFDGNGDFAAFLNSFAFDYNNSFSYSFWLKAPGQDLGVVLSNGDPDDGFSLEMANDGRLRIALEASNSGKKIEGKTTTRVDDNNWHHIAVTYNGNRMISGAAIYIDAVADPWISSMSSLRDYDVLQTAYNLTVAKRASGAAKYFKGQLDELLIFNRTLLPDEIASQYASSALRLNVSVRTCNSSDCNGQAWAGTFDNTPQPLSSLSQNRYFQFKASFETDNPAFSPELRRVALDYVAPDIAPPVISDVSISEGITSGSDATVRALVSDPESTVESVWLTTNILDELANYSMSKEGISDYFSASFPAGAVGSYYFAISSNDSQGNENSPVWTQFDVSKPSSSETSFDLPLLALPSSNISVSSSVLASDFIENMSIRLNVPDYFLFSGVNMPQVQEKGDINALSTGSAEWLVTVPSQLGMGVYSLNESWFDNYGNVWQGGSIQLNVTNKIVEFSSPAVLDSLVPNLNASVNLVNHGDSAQNVLVTWVLKRNDTGVALDAGQQEIIAGAGSPTVLTVEPSTLYEGAVVLEFSGQYLGTAVETEPLSFDFETQSLQDETAPIVSNISITTNLTSGEVATVRAQVTDDQSDIDSVWIAISRNGSNSSAHAMARDEQTQYYSTEFTAEAAGAYSFSISANDTAGNSGSALGDEFEVGKPSATVSANITGEELYPSNATNGTNITIGARVIVSDFVKNAEVSITLPAGFTVINESKEVMQEIGDLEPSDNVLVEWLVAVPSAPGDYTFTITFTDAYENVWHSQDAEIQVTAPVVPPAPPVVPPANEGGDGNGGSGGGGSAGGSAGKSSAATPAPVEAVVPTEEVTETTSADQPVSSNSGAEAALVESSAQENAASNNGGAVTGLAVFVSIVKQIPLYSLILFLLLSFVSVFYLRHKQGQIKSLKTKQKR